MSVNLNDLERRYQELGEEIEKIKKIKKIEEEERNASPRLKRPVAGTGDKYWTAGIIEEVYSSHANTRAPYTGFLSTNKAQAQAFADVVNVMAELRTQPGIVVPSGHNNREASFSIRHRAGSNGIDVHSFTYWDHHLVGPAFKTKEDALAAIKAVGEQRIIAAFKTLMFMTPESRGEV
jgi:hypothetical protein